MKVEEQQSRNFVSDDGRLGIMIELVDGRVAHITLARKGSGANAELTEAQVEQLAELLPAAHQYLKSLRVGQIG